MIQTSRIQKNKLLIQTKKFLILALLLKKKTDYSTEITDIESKIRSISGIAINSALNAVENKILAVTNLVEK